MIMIKNFSDINEIEKRTFYYLCGFSLFLPISKALGNIFMALSILGMIHRLYRKNDDVKIIFSEYKNIFATIGILFAAVVISALSSADILFGLKSFVDKYIGHILVLFPIILICLDREKILKLVQILLAGVFISNLAVIVQGIKNLDGIWRFGGFLTAMAQGSLIGIILPLYAVLILHIQKKSLRIYFVFAAVVAVVALLFNGTRGVYLSSAILIPAMILIYSRKNLKAFGIVIAILLVVGGMFVFALNSAATSETVSDMRAKSNSERMLVWTSAFNMFKDHPIFGVGYGQYKFEYKEKYISPYAKEPYLEHAHSNILQLLAECGILGAASFVFMWGYLTFYSLRRWFKDKKFEWLLFFCVLSGFMLHGLTEFNFETSVPSKFLWYSLGLCIAYDKISKNSAGVY